MKRDSSLTIRNKIIRLNITLLFVAGTVLALLFYYVFYSIRKESAYQELENSIFNVSKEITNNFEFVNNTLFSFSNTESIQKWKKKDIVIDAEDYYMINSIKQEITDSLLFSPTWQLKLIDSIYLVPKDQVVLLQSRYFVKSKKEVKQVQRIYDRCKDKEEKTICVPPASQKGTMYLVKKFRNNAMDEYLSFIVAINPNNFSTELKELPEYVKGNIIDGRGRIYFSNEEFQKEKRLTIPKGKKENNQNLNDSFETIIDHEKRLIVYKNLDKYDFNMVVSLSEDTLVGPIKKAVFVYMKIFAVILAVFITLSILFSSVLTKFVVEMSHCFHEVSYGNYKVRMPKYKEKDLNRISTSFNQMSQQIEKLINTVYKERLLVKETELKMLHAQMNPHFLMNTMTVISTTALLNQDMEVYKMITSLGELLDASLYITTKGDSYIKIAKELQYVECYLYLQQLRFQDKLSYSIQVSKKITDYYIPRLIIEPLVENAVVHGVEEGIKNVNVTVLVEEEGEQLLITVMDDGKGFNPEEIQKTNNEKGHHISINNIKQRIDGIFGADYGLRYSSQINVGTTVYITIPICKSPVTGEEAEKIDSSINC